MKKTIKEAILDSFSTIYYRTLRRIIPKYHDRTIFTSFYWRTLWDRLTKGFDETCTWSLDYSLAKLIAPRLQMFIDVATQFGHPGTIDEDIRNKYIEKGYNYDYNKNRFVEDEIRDKFYKDCQTEWKRILTIMQAAFQDIVDEEKDWDVWKEKYTINIKNLKAELDAAKSEKERAKIWNSKGFWREYRAGIQPSPLDFSNLLRTTGFSMFAKYYESLWW